MTTNQPCRCCDGAQPADACERAEPSGPDASTNYDADPAAIAWARAKLQRSVDRLHDFERQAIEKGAPERVERWRRTAKWIEWQILGTGEGCVITPFDPRLPQVEAMRSHARTVSTAGDAQ